MEKEVFWNARRIGEGYGKSDAPQVGEHIDGGKKEGDDPAPSVYPIWVHSFDSLRA